MGPGGEASPSLRRDHRRAHRRRPSGSRVRGTQRRAGTDAAGAIRGRLADHRRPRGRRTAHPARGGSRDHGHHPGVGRRAAPAAPRLLARLTEEVDAGGSDLLQATIFEVQRTRPVINGTAAQNQAADQVGGVGDSRAARHPGQHHAGPRCREQLRRRGGVQPGPLRRQSAGHACLDSVTGAASAAASAPRSRTWR